MATEMSSIAERIRDEREWLGFTQEGLAFGLNLPLDVIVAFESGAKVPDDITLGKLARFFGLTPERLRGEPLTEDLGMAILCGRRDLTSEDRYQVMRFAEYLRHAGPAPAAPESPAPVPSPVSAATEATGGATEAQEG